MAGENGIATAADFRRAAEARAEDEFEEPQRVVLPGSGLAVMIRRPRVAYFALRGLPLPQSLAVQGLDESEHREGDTQKFAERMVALLKSAVVSPHLSLDPGVDEISPNWLCEEDITFLFRYLVGEVLAGGQDLASFRAGPRPDAVARACGADVALPPESSAQADGDGVSG